MDSNRKNRIRALLKGIETGDPTSVQVINPEKYIQHNPQTYEGRDGLAALFKQLSLTSPRINIVRIFEDGDYVFAHTEYDFAQSNIGFEVFRFEEDMTVEHWDNIQLRKEPNASNHTMVSGPTQVKDLDKTEENRQVVQSYVNEVLINLQFSKLENYINDDQFTQHNPLMVDGKTSIIDALKYASIDSQGPRLSFLNVLAICSSMIALYWSTQDLKNVSLSPNELYKVPRLIPVQSNNFWTELASYPSFQNCSMALVSTIASSNSTGRAIVVT